MPFKFETIDFTRKSNASRVLRVVLFMSWCCVQNQDNEVNSDQLSLVGWWFYDFASKVKTFGATYFLQIQQQQLTRINHPISFSKQGYRYPFFWPTSLWAFNFWDPQMTSLRRPPWPLVASPVRLRPRLGSPGVDHRADHHFLKWNLFRVWTSFSDIHLETLGDCSVLNLSREPKVFDML